MAARSSRARVSRREALGAATGACLAAAAGAAAAQAPQGAESPVTPDDLAVLGRVSARAFTEAERALMAPSVTEMRAAVRLIRGAPRPQGAEPAFRFDPWVPGVPLPRGRAVFRPTEGPPPTITPEPDDAAYLSVIELSRLLRAGRMSSVELTRLYIERLKRLDEKLLCVVTLMEDRALRQAERADVEARSGRWRGPLHGIPWGAKDLLATKGTATTAGAKPYVGQVPQDDATVVKRLDKAGAVLIAKLSLGELAMGDVWFRGMTRCPWDLRLGSSGSSAGPSAATAAGLVGFAIGSETLGSIVSPCVRNGTTGLRPTYGRIPRTGAMALSWTMDKLGPICRSVEDCALVLSAIAGPDGLDLTSRDVPFSWEPGRMLEGLRIGVHSQAFERVKTDGPEGRIYARALDALTGAGAVLKPIRLPAMTGAFGELTNIIDVEGAAAFAELVDGGKLGDLAQQGRYNWPNIFRTGTTVAGVDYIAMMQLRAELQRKMAEVMADFDLYVTPPYGSLALTNLTGHPTLITRAGLDGARPVMIEFTGQLYREDAILRAGLVFERAMGAAGVWPKL